MSTDRAPERPGAPPISLLAVLALVLGLVCMPVGLPLSIVALMRVRKSEGRLGGRRVAWVALVLNLVLVPACGGLYLAFALPAFSDYRCLGRQSEARQNLKALQAAQEHHRSEHGAYAAELGALAFEPMGAPLHYDYLIVRAGADSFEAEARGKDDMAGDVWTATQLGEPRATRDLCGVRR